MKLIKLGDVEVKIRRAKVKEVKELIKDMAAKITEVANFFYHKQMTDEELLEEIPRFIIGNIESFEKYILKFTLDFTQEELDDLEFLSLTQLIKEIIVHNGISEDFLQSFFQNFKQASQETEVGKELIKEVPQV